MSTSAYLVYRWAYIITAASNEEVVIDAGAGAGELVAGTYYNEGDATSDDLILEFEQALNLAYTDAGYAGTTPTVSLGADGLVTITGGTTGFTIQWATGTFPASALGFTGTTTVVPTTPSTIVSTYQAANQWHPGISHVLRSYDAKKYNRFSRKNLTGRPYHLVHGTRNAEQVHTYDLIKGARVFDGLAAVAKYAAVAGLARFEPNTLEHFLEYALGTGSGEFYFYENNDPSTAVRVGPYVLNGDEEILDGVDPESYVADMSSAHYPVRLSMWQV